MYLRQIVIQLFLLRVQIAFRTGVLRFQLGQGLFTLLQLCFLFLYGSFRTAFLCIQGGLSNKQFIFCILQLVLGIFYFCLIFLFILLIFLTTSFNLGKGFLFDIVKAFLCTLLSQCSDCGLLGIDDIEISIRIGVGLLCAVNRHIHLRIVRGFEVGIRNHRIIINTAAADGRAALFIGQIIRLRYLSDECIG